MACLYKIRSLKFLVVLGDRKSPAEFAALLEKAYGGGFETERQGSLSDLYEKLESVRSKDPTNVRAYIGL